MGKGALGDTSVGAGLDPTQHPCVPRKVSHLSAGERESRAT